MIIAGFLWTVSLATIRSAYLNDVALVGTSPGSARLRSWQRARVRILLSLTRTLGA